MMLCALFVLMRMSIFAFATGILVVQQLATLPPVLPLVGVTILLVVVSLVVRACLPVAGETNRECGARCLASWVLIALAACCTGASWATLRAEWRLAEDLPMTWELQDVIVTGVVQGLPRQLDRARRFEFRVEQASAPVPRKIQLSWYPPRNGSGTVPDLRPGERWTLTVRLKRPHGFMNPFGFDYEAWLFERGIRATGYVREAGALKKLEEDTVGLMNQVHRVRDSIRRRFADVLGESPYRGVLTALAVGDQRAIPDAQWEVFRRTGTNHLMAISGLHVSLVALFAAGVVGGLWRCVPRLMLTLPSRKAAACGGLIFAAVYALLAGLGLPTQRALIMLSIVAVTMVFGRNTRPSRILALALLGVLVADPWAVSSAGFWLSFGAVAVILFVVSGRLAPPTGWRAAVRVQWAITLAMIPALLVLFNAFSLLAPIANAVAIPLVSFVVTPLTLIAIVLPVPAVLELAHWFAGGLMTYLESLSSLPFAIRMQPAQPIVLVVCGVIAAIWLLLPGGTPARHVALIVFLPLLMWQPARPEPGEFTAVVFDIGQGLAIHVQTHSHDLLYDTGPPYGPVVDAAQRVLLPYFTASGVNRLDALIISHGDADHVGGAASLIAAVPVHVLITNPHESHAALVERAGARHHCQAGQHWEWDRVRFEVLHPRADRPAYDKANDNSCVIRIVGAGGSMLLTGDIESVAERAVLGWAGERVTDLASDVVVVPHHGSRTSSSPAFVRAVSPKHAIHVAGSLNRFRHPHPEVWARWAQAGARNWRTDGQGAIRVQARTQGVELVAERMRRMRYWHGR